MSGNFQLEKATHIIYTYACAQELSALRSLMPTTRITLGMSIEHNAMGEMKKVLVFVSLFLIDR